MKVADIITITVLATLIFATCFLAHERGLEASSLEAKIASLEAQIQNLKPLPRINVARAAIYPLSGDVVVDVVKE